MLFLLKSDGQETEEFEFTIVFDCPNKSIHEHSKIKSLLQVFNLYFKLQGFLKNNFATIISITTTTMTII